ncbi:conserved domain protein [Bacteroides fluxus YIT 12057]|uniref:Conserved domain protein n=1 Tax=Bacteroides fluxus YIT 12057 TaxID=763034 RepID=F3PXW6_9BACE|nr:conserved domain protein [Bacteroides fluxus YIT 12057]
MTIIYTKKRKEQTMKRKHLVAIGVAIAILLLLYWLLVAEDMNAWLNVN